MLPDLFLYGFVYVRVNHSRISTVVDLRFQFIVLTGQKV